eukprot:10060562-Alexandrium_andersonii.AAC.1
MAEAKGEETSSSPAAQVVDDTPPASAPDSTPLVQERLQPEEESEGDACEGTVPEEAAPLGAMSSRNSLRDWVREGHTGQVFTSDEAIARRGQELGELRRQSVTVRQGILGNADQSHR